MLQHSIEQTHRPAPLMARPRLHAEVQLGGYQADITGENRLGFGADAINGVTFTGCDAHAAVRMHAAPATGSPWSFDHKGKSMASTPSAGTLRTS